MSGNKTMGGGDETGQSGQGNENKPWRPAWLQAEETRMKPLSEAVAWTSAAAEKQSKPVGKDKTIPSVAGKGHSPFEEAANLGILPTAELDSQEVQRGLAKQREELKQLKKEKHVNAAHDAGLQPRPGDTRLRTQLGNS